MEYMRQFQDKHFELAIVDPPYGIDYNMHAGKRKNKRPKYEKKDWDKSTPDKCFFTELFRVSKNQIIWGGNYFKLPQTGAWVFWDKCVPVGLSFADGELAWTSFSGTLKKVEIQYSGIKGREQDRFHPTQKPIALYKWLLANYANPGDKILDTHLGSGSSRIAAYDMGFDFYATEIDTDYFADQEARFKAHVAKPVLFEPNRMYQAVQSKMEL